MNLNKNIFRLKHILESIDKINSISKDLSHEKFAENWILQDAVIRNLEVIGEASNHIDDELKNEYPEVAWNEIRGLRNIIAHVYFEIDTKQIWNTIQDNIPELQSQIQQILKKLE